MSGRSWWGGEDVEDDERGSRRFVRERDDGHAISGVQVVRTTDAAILVRGRGVASDPFGLDDPTAEAWVPRSQVHDDSVDVPRDAGEGDRGTLVVTTWFARKSKLTK